MRFRGLAGLRNYRAETEQPQRERPLGACRDRHARPAGGGLRAGVPRAGGLGADGPAEDGPDPRGRVLQVRTGVAAERDHSVPVEDVRALPRGRQVRVLHGADADGFGYRAKLCGIEAGSRVKLVEDAARTIHGFLQ